MSLAFETRSVSFTAALISPDKDEFLQITEECKNVRERHQILFGPRAQNQRPHLISIVLQFLADQTNTPLKRN